MSTLDFFKALQASSFGRFVGSLDHMVHAGIQLMHITGMILLLSSVVLISFRIFGFGLRLVTVSAIVHATRNYIWVGLALLIISGVLMLAPSATNYYANDFFWDKLVLLALALVVQLSWFKNIKQLDTHSSFITQFTTLLTVTLWFGVAFAGRFIGFF